MRLSSLSLSCQQHTRRKTKFFFGLYAMRGIALRGEEKKIVVKKKGEEREKNFSDHKYNFASARGEQKKNCRVRGARVLVHESQMYCTSWLIVCAVFLWWKVYSQSRKNTAPECKKSSGEVYDAATSSVINKKCLNRMLICFCNLFVKSFNTSEGRR